MGFDTQTVKRLTAMFYNARSRARRDKLPFAITLEDIKASWPADGLCPMTGMKLNAYHVGRGPKPDAPSLDKIVPELGYIPGNIAIVSYRANSIMQDSHPDEVIRVATVFKQMYDRVLRRY